MDVINKGLGYWTAYDRSVAIAAGRSRRNKTKSKLNRKAEKRLDRRIAAFELMEKTRKYVGEFTKPGSLKK